MRSRAAAAETHDVSPRKCKQMLSIESVNQRQATCLRCEGRFRVVVPGGSGEQEELARVLVRSGRLQFIGALRESTGCGLTDAKGVVQHLTTMPRRCHRCESAIRDRLLTDCPQCGALNIQLGRPMEDVTCPACGFHVLAYGYGSYEICEICGWEDDGVQLANPTSGGGANKQSLAEVQAEILRRIPLDCMKQGELHRDSRWRPLNARELATAEERRAIKYWHTPAVVDRGDAYWLRSSAKPERAG